ncbi:MAG: hypothetical protein IKE03_07175 [Blautia sp.]|nr:hypothetical protein [Blautia sp.]
MVYRKDRCLRQTALIRVCALALLALLAFFPLREAAASAFDPSAAGSIQVSLSYQGQPLGNVGMIIYKVGSYVTGGDGSPQLVLDAPYASTGLDVSSLTTSEQVLNAAYQLTSIAYGSSAETAQETYGEGASDDEGYIHFTDLEPGLYLVLKDTNMTDPYTVGGEEREDPGDVRILPSLVDVPKWTEAGYVYDVPLLPKLEIDDRRTSLTVTKYLYLVDIESDTGMIPIMAMDTEIEVGLFYDPAGNLPVGDDYTRTIHITGSSSGTATYDNLPAGTYYLMELMDGDPIPVGEIVVNGDGIEFATYIDNTSNTGNEIQLDVGQEAEAMGAQVDNLYYDLPDGFFKSGEIYLYKEVRRAGQAIEVDDTFYAGIYHVVGAQEGGQEELIKVQELKLFESVPVEVPLVDDDTTGYTLFHVVEMTKNANGEYVPVDDSFSYFVEISDGGTVRLHYDEQDDSQLSKRVNIINNVKISPTPTPTVTPTPGVTQRQTYSGGGGSSSGSYNPGGSTSVTQQPPTQAQTIRTGDDTPILLYVLLMAAAALAAGFIAGRRASRRNKK